MISAQINSNSVSEILRECARESILPYFRKLSENEINYKHDDPQNKVTIADHKSEAFLSEKLTALLPDSVVVGEEGTYEDDSVLDYLLDSEKLVWVIDPVDGTNNFAKGSEIFCIILAFVEKGRTQMAWIYDVCNDSMAFSEKGKGVFIDGKQIFINQTIPPDGGRGFANYKFADRIKDIKIDTLRCAGHEYLTILKNEAIFSLYAFMRPWDNVAGSLMIEEAGGYVAKWDGTAYLPEDAEGGVIAANSKETWQKIIDYIPRDVLKKYS